MIARPPVARLARQLDWPFTVTRNFKNLSLIRKEFRAARRNGAHGRATTLREKPTRCNASEDLQKRILVVEDESLIAADLELRIARLGYPAPVIAHSAEEALECARSTRFDLVLMDVRLKGDMDGVAAAAALRSELRTPVVYVTAHADEETVERANSPSRWATF
jgi:CheY-like chemotaxis protein